MIVLYWSVKLSGIMGAGQKEEKGLPRPSLTALAYSLAVLQDKKYAKPAHDGNLQVPPRAARAGNVALTSR